MSFASSSPLCLNKLQPGRVKLFRPLALGEEQHYTLNMKQLPFVTGAHLRCALLATLCFGVLAGCGKNDIRVYTIPKEKPSLAEAGPGAQPQIHWKLPAGWEERAGDQMR